MAEETPNVEIEEPLAEELEEIIEEQIDLKQEFYANLAEDMDERVLSRMAQELLADYK